MTEDQILISHARDLKQKCANLSMITSTAFLDLRQKSLLLELEKENQNEVSTFYYGGFDEAERVCAVFVPSFFGVTDINKFFKDDGQSNPICLLKIEKDKFSSFSHRDCLGALMALGIKRQTVGDIIIDDDGCFVVLFKNTADFVVQNLTSVGRATVKISKSSFDAVSVSCENVSLIPAFVSSLRLDSYVSAAFGLSRTKASAAIEKGLVFLNDAQCLKTDSKLSCGDKIVLRGSGKTVFLSCNGKSKKGREHITIKKYL